MSERITLRAKSDGTEISGELIKDAREGLIQAVADIIEQTYEKVSES